MYRLFVILAIVIVASGCASTKQPPTDHAQQEATFKELTKDWFAAETRRDMEASMAFLAPDAIIQGEGTPTTQHVRPRAGAVQRVMSFSGDAAPQVVTPK
jgi:hypothetical protein